MRRRRGMLLYMSPFLENGLKIYHSIQRAENEARPGLGGGLARDEDVPPRFSTSACPPGSHTDEDHGKDCDFDCV